MTTPLRQRLTWDGGAVHDGPRRYLLMRPDVLMGAAVRMPDPAREAWFDAIAASAREHGGASLAAYAATLGGDVDALVYATTAAAADLGWGRWTVVRRADGLVLDVEGSPFADGWRAAAGVAAPGPVCAPVRGLLSALAGLVLGRDAAVDERHCAAVHGGSSCRFEARASGGSR